MRRLPRLSFLSVGKQTTKAILHPCIDHPQSYNIMLYIWIPEPVFTKKTEQKIEDAPKGLLPRPATPRALDCLLTTTPTSLRVQRRMVFIA